MTWRHTETVNLPGAESCRQCFADARHCTTPTPDPSSPCGYPGCIDDGFTHCDDVGKHWHSASWFAHHHVPTLCQSCHHGVTR